MAEDEISRPTTGLVGFDKKFKKLIAQLSSLVNSIQLNREEPSRARNDINNVS